MSIKYEPKAELIKPFARHEKDTGSPEVQIAILTARIRELTEHLKIHKHDQHSRRGLFKMVGSRRRHLRYLSRTNPESYRDVLKRLELRR
ncbi:MAG: 30S ribosomal protein S15 [Phototrophicales bacterium]|nr:30S ribosomal protein S15 [Phototrophicales bacterium]